MVISCLSLHLARNLRAKVLKFSEICKFLGWKVYIAAKMPQKKSASADLSVILIYSLFLFMRQKEQVTSPARCGVICPPMAGEFETNVFQIYFSSFSIISQWPL